jgi:WD40-like Beta Propeller Repeat
MVASVASIALLCLACSTATTLAAGPHVIAGAFGTEGTGNGQFKEPSGVAVNDSTEPLVEPAAGDVYVVDSGNNRVEVFTSEGTYLSEFNGSLAPAGEFSSPEAIAIDNSGDPLTDPSAGDVYVTDVGHGVIDKFSSVGTYEGQLTGACASPGTCPGSVIPFGELLGVTVDPAGNIWVYDSHENLYEFSDTGSFVKMFNTERGAAPGLAVDSSDNLYLDCSCELALKFSSTGQTLAEFAFGPPNPSALAIDPATNNLFVAKQGGEGIEEYEPSGESSSSPLDAFGAGEFSESRGIAVSGVSGTVFASDRGVGKVDVFINPPETGPASDLLETSATLSGLVPPYGMSVSACEFEYGAEAGVYPHTISCAQSTPFSGKEPVPVSANISGLSPGTVYHYRLRVAVGAGQARGQDQTFRTPAPLTIAAQSVTNVASTSATFAAQINPGGSDTTYRVEYGATTSYGASVPVPAGDAGSGVDAVAVSVLAHGLQPSTTYHYRFVAGNAVEPDVQGLDQTFTTQTVAGTSTLPDSREWELVSPANKHGSQILPSTDAVMQAAEAGGAITYYATQPTEAEPAGNALLSQVLSKRDSSGWSSQDIAPPHELPVEPTNGSSESEVVFFSSDLTNALVEPSFDVSEATEKNLYLRNNTTGAYEPLGTASNLLPGTKLLGHAGGFNISPGLEFVTATPDLSHVVVRSDQRLTEQGSPGSKGEIYYYEWVGGQLRFITQGNGSDLSIGGPGMSGEARHAISDDGSRIFFTNGDALSMADVASGEIVKLNVAQGVSEPASNRPEFQIASSDGSRVFFSDPGQLTTEPGGGLYMYDVESGKLTLLTVPVNTGEATGVEGIVSGASEDGSYVYLVARGVLTENTNAEGEKALAGADNLYMLHGEVRGGTTEWRASFVAGLAAEDQPDWASNGKTAGGTTFFLTNLTARVSPDGGQLAFMSDRSLTGYDNIDVNEETGPHADEEVFLYNASSGLLVCASCDPTGARPAGRLEAGGSAADLSAVWLGRWVAGSVPAWVSFTADRSALYQPRYLSDSGRLFFDSPDALVSRDTNAAEDVYEYEPAGAGDCTRSSAAYSGRAEGCVALISGGKGEQESAFADASANGSDVFFVTTEKLVPQDVDNAYDMYDAHECTGSSPCFPVAAVQPPECVTADACRAAPTPQPSLFGSPSSATFAGAGNIAPPASTSTKPKQKIVKCAKGKKLSHGKCVKKRKARKAKKAKKASRDRRQSK